MNKPFYYQYDFSSAFLANMSSRLAEKISTNAQAIFNENDIKIPATDVSLMLYLNLHGSSSIADVARALGYSHQRVALRIALLEKLTLIKRKVDPNDQRCKVIILTKKAQQEMLFIEKIFTQAATKIDGIFEQMGINLMHVIPEVIDALDKSPLQSPPKNNA